MHGVIKALFSAYLSVRKNGSKLELTARGPLAIFTVVLVLVFAFLAGDQLLHLLAERGASDG